MKGMKEKLLKKLKTIKTIGYVRPERILQVNASDGFVPNSPPNSNVRAYNHAFSVQEEPKKIVQKCVPAQEPEIIDVSELMKDLEDQDAELVVERNDKENIMPKTVAKDSVFVKGNLENLSPLKQKNQVFEGKGWRSNTDRKAAPLGEINVSNFRRPALDSGTIFDPNLLEAFEQAVMEVKAQEADRRAKTGENNFQGAEKEPPLKVQRREGSANPLLEFEEKCPPGGSDSVILYTTGLRGIRKTFEDCQSIRFLFENLRVLFYERDISMHSGYKDELWEILGERVVPPRLFIKGRYIGGAEEVLALHEQGKFRSLLEGIPIDSSDGQCGGCDGIRFIMCFLCNGCRKITPDDDAGEPIKCPHCNENGIIICPMCS